LWFLKNVQRRADKPGRHAHSRYLAAQSEFAKRIIRFCLRFAGRRLRA
jgi:hypothetical protein